MLSSSRVLLKLCANHSGHRLVSHSAQKLARFGGDKTIGTSFKKALDKNPVAKKIYGQGDGLPRPSPEFGNLYVQGGGQLRPARHLWRAFGFFVGTGLVSFTCASIVEYHNIGKKFRHLIEETVAHFKRIYFGQSVSREVDKSIVTLIGLNGLVFLLWRVTKLQPLMSRYFTQGFASKSLVLPMLLSMFSHNFFFHLAANMYVLYSFANPSIGFLGREQFLAFYLTGGVFSSFFSLLEKAATRSVLPSLGASGAITALIGYVCTMAPDAKLSIIFFPYYHFSAQNALYSIIAFETFMMFIGAFTRFKIFDSAAHLGGLLFGIWYAHYGEEFYRRSFMPKVVRWWQKSGFDHSRSSEPVIVYDGKKHVQTTMDQFEKANFNMHNLAEQKEKEEKKRQQHLRRMEWEQYREKQLEKQRRRKQEMLDRRKRQADQQEQTDEEEEE